MKEEKLKRKVEYFYTRACEANEKNIVKLANKFVKWVCKSVRHSLCFNLIVTDRERWVLSELVSASDGTCQTAPEEVIKRIKELL